MQRRAVVWLLITWLTLSGSSLASIGIDDSAAEAALSASSCKLVVTPQAERRFSVSHPGVYAPDTPNGLGTIDVKTCTNEAWRITVVLDPWDGLVHHNDSRLRIAPERIHFRVFDKVDKMKQGGYVGGTEVLQDYQALSPYGYPVVVSTARTHPDSAYVQFLIDMETDWTSIAAGAYTGTLVFTIEAPLN